MSTVGFGDISAVTYFGRIFMMIFISIGLVCENWELNAMYYLTLRLNELEILVTVASSDSREVLYSPFSTLLTKILQTRHAISKETN